MSSYKWMYVFVLNYTLHSPPPPRFNSCRYPVKPSDIAKKFDYRTNQHIVFIRNNKFFEVSIVEDGQVLSAAELEAYVPLDLRMIFDILMVH